MLLAKRKGAAVGCSTGVVARFLIVASGCVMAALPLATVSAHHSFAAEFTRKRPIEVTGTVTKVQWMNPHARFYVESTGKNGVKVTWNFELTTPNILIRQGWTRHSLKPGDKVTVKGFGAKDGKHVGSASTVLLADGRRVFGQPRNSDSAK